MKEFRNSSLIPQNQGVIKAAAGIDFHGNWFIRDKKREFV
jgi:hypothetical protein